MTRTIKAALAACMAGALAAPAIGAAATTTYHHTTHHYQYSRHSGCMAAHHRSANRGTLIGAVAGGIVGSQLAGRGSRTGGTLIGAGVGAVAGHQIGAHAHRCR